MIVPTTSRLLKASEDLQYAQEEYAGILELGLELERSGGGDWIVEARDFWCVKQLEEFKQALAEFKAEFEAWKGQE